MPKVPREIVLDEHANGAPHISIDEKGEGHHYDSKGNDLGGVTVIPVRVIVERQGGRSGPAQVATARYRSGWAAINWGPKNPGGLPS